jgi:hypothetical protein
VENMNRISHHIEVDLLIRAHFCFKISHHFQGIAQVLKTIKDRVGVREGYFSKRKKKQPIYRDVFSIEPLMFLLIDHI